MSSPSLYLGFEYLDGFYEGLTTDLLTPQGLSFYRTSVDNVYVFYWTLPPAAYVPGLKKFIYELQLDTVNTFDSPDFQSFGLNVVQTLLINTTTADIFSEDTIGSSTFTLLPNTFIGKIVEITAGTGVGQLRRITANTGTTLTTEFDWSTPPDGTSQFIVYASNVQNFQNGNVAKGYQIQVPSRTAHPKETLYARVRTLGTTIPVSSFSATLQFNLMDRYDLTVADNLIDDLADINVYPKDVTKLPEDQRKTLLWKIMLMYGKEFDRAWFNTELTRTDLYLALTRDEQLFDHWGTFFNFIKPVTMQYVDYRLCLRALVIAALEGSSIAAIIQVARAFTGVNPDIFTIRSIADFFLTTLQEQFFPDGSTNVYQITQSDTFITSSLSIFRDNATTHALLTPNLDYSADESIPGFTTTLTDTSGTTLTAFYDISEPSPVVFDPTDGLSITGVVGLTHGGADVYGTDTQFTSDLLIGDQISDGQVWGTVQYINDDAHLTLSDAWIGDTELIDVLKLTYTDTQLPPPTAWAKATEAFGIEVLVHNPGDFDLNQELIDRLIQLVLPAHILAFIVFD